MGNIDYRKIFQNLPWEKIMNKARENGEMSHAYIMFSKDTEFLREFFLHQARMLQGGCGDCGKCRSCVSIEKGTSPDFFCFPEEKYSVEDAEKIVSECAMRPFEFSTKIFLLLDFDDASSAVQNKLLKVIEEPPKNVFFFISAKIFDKVLPTIRSRCVKFFLKEFEADEIESQLATVFPDRQRAKLAGILALGKLSKGAELYEVGNLEERSKDAIEIVSRLKTSKDLLDCKGISDKYQKTAEEFLYLLQIVYRDILMAKTGLIKLVFFQNQLELFDMIAREFSNDALVEISSQIAGKLEELQFGASSVGVLDTALLKIVEVKNTWR